MTVVIDNVKPYRGFAMGQNPQVLDKVSVEVMTYSRSTQEHHRYFQYW